MDIMCIDIYYVNKSKAAISMVNRTMMCAYYYANRCCCRGDPL